MTKRMRLVATLSFGALAIASVGCTTKIPPPQPPPFAGEIVVIDIGEVSLADTASASHAIVEPIKLPHDAMLRMKGVYRFVDGHKDLPINIDIMRMGRNGRPVLHSSGASGPETRTGTTYSFTTDLPGPISERGEFDLRMRAGKRFIAQGKVIVKD